MQFPFQAVFLPARLLLFTHKEKILQKEVAIQCFSLKGITLFDICSKDSWVGYAESVCSLPCKDAFLVSQQTTHSVVTMNPKPRFDLGSELGL